MNISKGRDKKLSLLCMAVVGTEGRGNTLETVIISSSNSKNHKHFNSCVEKVPEKHKKKAKL